MRKFDFSTDCYELATIFKLTDSRFHFEETLKPSNFEGRTFVEVGFCTVSTDSFPHSALIEREYGEFLPIIQIYGESITLHNMEVSMYFKYGVRYGEF